jgi:hypothetical protein
LADAVVAIGYFWETDMADIGFTDDQLASATDFTKADFDKLVDDFLADRLHDSRIQLGDGTVITDRAGMASVLAGDPMADLAQRLALAQVGGMFNRSTGAHASHDA